MHLIIIRGSQTQNVVMLCVFIFKKKKKKKSKPEQS